MYMYVCSTFAAMSTAGFPGGFGGFLSAAVGRDREGRREGGREGGRERGREGGRERGGREGGRERGRREGGREGERRERADHQKAKSLGDKERRQTQRMFAGSLDQWRRFLLRLRNHRFLRCGQRLLLLPPFQLPLPGSQAF